MSDEPSKSSNQDAAAVRSEIAGVLADVQTRIGQWHQQIAFLQGQAGHRPSEGARRAIRKVVKDLKHQVAAERMAIIAALADRPPKIAGHPRVVDIERSFDGVAAALDALERV